MSTIKTTLKRWLPFFGLILVGALAFALLKGVKKEPSQRPLVERGRSVRVVEVKSATVTPRAIGHGVVSPKQEWKMALQVGGRVVDMSDQLKVGAFVKKGTRLLRLDPTDYKLAARRQTAGVSGARSQIAQLNAQLQSTKASLKIEERALALASRDLDRKRSLARSGSASSAEVDAAERAHLVQQKQVQSLKNILREIPISRRVVRSQISQARVGLKDAKLDVARTSIVAPFDIRIRSLNVQEGEVVAPNQVLAVADGVAVAEVNAQFSLSAIRPLIPFRPEVAQGMSTLSSLPEFSSITADIGLQSGDILANWPARVDRFTTVDPITRTMGVIVAVDNPYKQMEPGIKPALLSGLYVSVELRGKSRPGCLAVPRSALREDPAFKSARATSRRDAVHLVDDKSRLVIRPVVVGIRQSKFVCIKEGLQAGEKVILTTLTPAIEGMLLDSKDDVRTAASLAAAVMGPPS